MFYTSKYIHKISNPSGGDEGRRVRLDEVPTVTRDLARVLRREGLLGRGERLLDHRIEPDGRVVAFPAASPWHSIILTPLGA